MITKDTLTPCTSFYSLGPGPRAKNRFSDKKKILSKKRNKYACICLKHQNIQRSIFHNYEAGQCVSWMKPYGKIHYEFLKAISKINSGTGLGVIVTLAPTPNSKGLVHPVRVQSKPTKYKWDFLV